MSLNEKPPQVSIIVANWNGAEWVHRCISSLQISARQSRLRFEIIVVDDASTDGSPEAIAERFPAVMLIRNDRNIGFARSINHGANAARGAVVILCNNDLLPKEQFVAELARPFFASTESEKRLRGGRPLFAVSAKTVGWYDGKPNQLCMGARWRGGRITPAWSDPAEISECLFAQAGAAAYSRKLWKKLGGLSTLYEPGYWEDYDLSWRAAKAGFAQLYNPRAYAIHVGGGSMQKRYGDAGVKAMKARNHLLFEAANIQSPALLLKWLFRIPVNLLQALGDPKRRIYARALLEMTGRLPVAMAQRRRLRNAVTDHELLEPYRDFTSSF
ncbi:hypothetical protein BH09SUM1_BH09SUM1_05420 [soil metagenome]